MNTPNNATTIVAPTSREALRLVREQLGPDAVILSNRAHADGVEIIAIADSADLPPVPSRLAPRQAVAPERPVMPVMESPPAVMPTIAPIAAPSFAATMDPAISTRPIMPVMAAVPAVAPIVAPVQVSLPVAALSDGLPPGPATDSVISEIHAMRSMIEEQFAGLAWNDKQRRDPVRGHLLRMLLGAGFSARLAKAMLDHLPTGQNFASGTAWVKAELARNLPVMENESAMMDSGGVYALMGPTGVGKTTTTAKLAARCVMRFGPEKLALLTTDSYRIGAFEQLRIYGQILGVSVHAVKDASDLRLVLNDLRDKHMVLIDTVGKSQRDRSVSDQVAMLCGAGRPVKRLLLLNAACHGDTLNEVVHAYKHGAGDNELAGCIFTKVDEATHPGVLIDTVIRHRLPVHYVSTGQKVPENLMVADRLQLVESVFQAESRSALFVPGEADLDQSPTPLPQEVEGAAAEAVAQAAQAALMARLRTQCQQLIRALTHDAQELSANVDALAGGQIGFDGTRALWRDLTDDTISTRMLEKKLLMQASTEVDSGCDAYVLAMGGKVALHSEQSGDAYALHGSLLLSDRDGIPLAAPHQLLTTAASMPDSTSGKAAAASLRQLDWLRQQDFGKPMVHLPERMPLPDMLLTWQASGLCWLVRGRATSAVIDADGKPGATLARLADKLAFAPPQSVMYKGKAALQSLAEMPVRLRLSVKGRPDTEVLSSLLPTLRCVVARIVDPQSGKLLAHWYLLSNLGAQVSGSQLVAWYRWRVEVDPYFRLLKEAVNQLGGCGQPGDADMLKRMLTAGQASITVWRLLQARDDWAKVARSLLVQLSGRPVRAGAARPASAAVLFEGLGKLFVLLETLALTLDADSGMASQRVPGVAAVQG
ncbi:flagellar biosynthesis protein FlhF [Glaciimonas sp. PAMC28666]|uniref:flagellar biosynthesis protein FlhF n=1 Tax=Glaciimonas sp. PAMC28666 TaxID=2807626 RepID=UPI001F03B04E|nr:flagellar biosynthesis protein FlhF [Glaciimonas sp. PAMC28666]